MAQPHKQSKTGDIVTIDKLIKSPLSVLAPFSPIQSLNGQANPYPPGGSPQRWDEDWEVGNYDSSTGQKNPVTNQIRNKNYIPVIPNTTYYFKTNTNSRVLYYQSDKTYINSELKKDATFTTPADCYYINFHLETGYGTTYNHDISINYPSTNHDYHPYSNFCPISGWTGCDVNGTGKNLFDPSSTANEWVAVGGTTVTTRNNAKSNRIPCSAGDTITASSSNDTASTNIILIATLDGNGTVLSRSAEANGTKYLTVTAPANAVEFLISYGTYGNAGDAQVEKGSTATSYSAYSGTTIPVNWTDAAGTVYGGSLKVNTDGTGVLTEEMATVDLGTLRWVKASSTFYASFSRGKYYGKCYCSQYKQGNAIPANMANNTICVGNSEAVPILRIRDDNLFASCADGDAFTTAMDGVQFVYTLATPVIHNLTAEQVGQLLALNGVNNVWSDVNEQITVSGWGH